MASQVQIGRAYVVIGGKAGPLYKTLGRVSRRMRRFGESMQSVGKQMSRLAAVAAVPFALAARSFARFSDQMSAVKAVTGATEQEFMALTETAKELGRTTSFTASEVAAGMLELSRAGFSAGESIEAISGILDIARGTATEMGESANIVAATIKQFGLRASDTTFIVDLLTKTANSSAQTLTDLGESMGYVGAVANAAGQDIRDVAATVGVLANAGIKGSRAGTGLARILKNMSTGKAQGILADLGIQVQDAEGNFRKISAVLSDLIAKTKALGSVEKLRIFEDLFGRGAVSALSVTTEAFDEMRAKLADVAGTAKTTAAVMDDNLGGAWRRATSAVEGLALAVGGALDTSLRSLLNELKLVAGRLTEFVEQNRSVVLGMAQFIAGIAGIGVALTALGGVIAVTGFALKGFLLLLSPVGLMGVGLLAVLYLAGAFDLVGAAAEKLPKPVRDFGKAVGEVFGLVSTVALAAMDVVVSVIRDAAARAFNFWYTGLCRPALETGLDMVLGLVKAFDLVTNGIRQPVGDMLNVLKNIAVGIVKIIVTVADKIIGVLAGVLRLNIAIAKASGLVPDFLTEGMEKGLKAAQKFRRTLKGGLDGFTDDMADVDLGDAADKMFDPLYEGIEAVRGAISTELEENTADLAKAGLSNAVAVLGNRLSQMANLDDVKAAGETAGKALDGGIADGIATTDTSSSMLDGVVKKVPDLLGTLADAGSSLLDRIGSEAAGLATGVAGMLSGGPTKSNERPMAPRVSSVGSFSAREAQSANSGLTGSMTTLTGAVKKLDGTMQKTAARVPVYGA